MFISAVSSQRRLKLFSSAGRLTRWLGGLLHRLKTGLLKTERDYRADRAETGRRSKVADEVNQTSESNEETNDGLLSVEAKNFGEVHGRLISPKIGQKSARTKEWTKLPILQRGAR